MKIGIVCYPTYGGSGVLATELGMELAKRGHQVHFITYALPIRLDRFQDNVYFHEVEIPSYPLMEHQLYTLALAGKIIDVVKYEQLDILHVHYAIPHAISGYLAKQILNTNGSIKLVTTLHGTDITLVGLEPEFHPLVKFSLDQSDAVTAVSQYLLEKTKQNFTPRNDIRVISNFVDTSLYVREPERCDSLRRRVAKDGEKILMHISNFRAVKRVQDTIRILAEVRNTINAKLILVGDGPDRTDTERLARELNVSDAVMFLGKQTALPQILSAADVFLLPSQSESFGLSALEAMSCSVPVVASNVGGIPEVVTHGENGYIAEFGDVTRMAKYTAELLTNPKKWEVFSANARRTATEKFDTKLIIPQYETLYTELVG
ncbi:MAG: N-acetyl-alpha-D-glucosaminyl L-malate synthase BshA [Candidatus Kapabacteria bacterium]|nr:N-acetyl-alpha-D-glucosaminyl L-malate synthase BshA [Candidatus Kapabacteria bacterium]